MTKGRKSTPPPRRNPSRTQTQESPVRKKKKEDDNDKSSSTKKSKTQTRKEKASDDTATTTHDDDAMSVDTPKGNNKSDTFIDSSFTSFLYFRFKVAASKKGSETMRAKIQELYKIVQVADSDICLLHYKIDI